MFAGYLFLYLWSLKNKNDLETIADEELLKQIAEVLEVNPEVLKHVNLDDV